jgi:hypothetical protein
MSRTARRRRSRVLFSSVSPPDGFAEAWRSPVTGAAGRPTPAVRTLSDIRPACVPRHRSQTHLKEIAGCGHS